MKRHYRSGMSLSEMVVALLVFALVTGACLALFQTGNQYFHGSMARVDVQTSAQIALTRIAGELRESNMNEIETGPSSLLLISARNAGQFQFSPAFAPYWQKWVVYYLAGFNGVPSLVRQEGVPAGLSTPALPAVLTVVPTIASDWLARFQNAAAAQTCCPVTLVAANIQSFTPHLNADCVDPGPAVFLSITSSKVYGANASRLNPGESATSPCSSYGGNYVEVLLWGN